MGEGGGCRAGVAELVVFCRRAAGRMSATQLNSVETRWRLPPLGGLPPPGWWKWWTQPPAGGGHHDVVETTTHSANNWWTCPWRRPITTAASDSAVSD